MHLSSAALCRLSSRAQNHTQLRPSDPTYLTALMVPSLLQRPDLPLLITEDDVVFAPDANARLATVRVYVAFAPVLPQPSYRANQMSKWCASRVNGTGY